MAFQVTEVQKALKGVDYPASSEQLADRASKNGADRELVDTLRGMGKQTFEGPNAVMKGLKGQLGGSR
jgi:2-keto-3-deoxy-galactonokinase